MIDMLRFGRDGFKYPSMILEVIPVIMEDKEHEEHIESFSIKMDIRGMTEYEAKIGYGVISEAIGMINKRIREMEGYE